MGDRVLLTLGMSSGVGLLPLVHPCAEAAIAWVGIDLATPAADEIIIMWFFDCPGSEFLVSIHDSIRRRSFRLAGFALEGRADVKRSHAY